MTEEKKVESKEPLQNDFVTVIATRKPQCVLQLEVTTLPPLMNEAAQQGFKNIRKEVQLPGFRKGKVPKNLIEKKYQDKIAAQTKQAAAELALNQAIQLVKEAPLNSDTKVSFNVKTDDPERPTFTYEYEVEPTIPKIDSKDCTIAAVAPQTIGEAELEEAIRQLRFFYAKWEPVTDRPIQEDDFIIIDLETTTESPETVFSDTRFEVSDKSMASWMKELVLGKVTGDIVTGTSKLDANATEEEKEHFQEKPVTLTIKQVETATLPPLDDKLANQAGAKDVAEFKTNLKALLTSKAAEKADKQTRQAVNEFLIEKYPIEVPKSLVLEELEHRKKQLISDPERKKDLEAMDEEQRQNFATQLYVQSGDAVRLFYLSRYIIRQENIAITEEEVLTEASNTLREFGPVNVDKTKIPPAVKALALSRIILRKAQDFMLQPIQNTAAT